ncbi:MAG: N-methyl-L-tryptophan oxidase [Lysinibacillus sp.]
MFDTIIIGAGSMGLAAAYYSARDGQKTLAIDAHTPPHDFGTHHGETRLIRYAYGEGEKYVPFVLRAKELWEELEQLTNTQIVKPLGVINFAPKQDIFLQNVKTSAQNFQLQVEQLSAIEVNKRWAGLSLPKNVEALYEPTAGVLMTDNIMNGYLQLAKKAGLQLHTNDAATKIDIQQDNSIIVTTASGETFHGKRLIISVGAWSKQLLQQFDLEVPIRTIRKTFAWYEVDEALYSESIYPGFAYINGTEGYYGFPSINGAGLKVGRHDEGVVIDANDDKAPFGEVDGDAEDLQQFLHTFMPQVGKLKYGKTCMYDMTPDEDFIIDTHPKYENIAFAGGFSGHGFKFASAVGEALHELVTVGKTKVDLQTFSIKRFQ